MTESKIEITENCLISLALFYNYLANDLYCLTDDEITAFINFMNNLLKYHKSNYVISKIDAFNEEFGYSVLSEDTGDIYILESLEKIKAIYNFVVPTELINISLEGFKENKDLENPLLAINVDGNKLTLKQY